MRRLRPPLAATLLTALSCGGPLVTIEVDRDGTTVVPQGTVVEQILSDIGFEDFQSFDLSASQELQNEGVEPGDIEGVVLSRLSLSATAPDGADLAFLDSVQFYAQSPQLPRVLVASYDAFVPGESVAIFTLEDVDLTAYATADSMTISADVSGSRPSQETTIRARAIFEVGVTAQGACAAASAN